MENFKRTTCVRCTREKREIEIIEYETETKCIEIVYNTGQLKQSIWLEHSEDILLLLRCLQFIISK